MENETPLMHETDQAASSVSRDLVRPAHHFLRILRCAANVWFPREHQERFVPSTRVDCYPCQHPQGSAADTRPQGWLIGAAEVVRRADGGGVDRHDPPRHLYGV